VKCSELFRQIEELVPTLGGWSSVEKVCEFAAYIVAHRPVVTGELGTWMGRGAAGMALAHRFVGVGKVYVVDPWSASASAQGQEGPNAEWWNDQAKHDLAYQNFKDTIRVLGLEDWVVVQRATSDEATLPPLASGLTVIDSNHGPQAIKDVEKWAPHVALSGLVYLDDIAWGEGHVEAAAKRLIQLGFAPLYQQDTGMFFQKLK
jgi:hypothetical protein